MKETVFEIIVLLISASYEVAHAAETTTLTPENNTENLFPICKRNDTNLDECIYNATVTLREQLLDGFPELSIPSLNPLKVPTIKLQQSTESLDFKAVLMDVKIYGLTDYDFFDIKSDMENHTIKMSALFNHVYVNTEVMVMGTYEDLPIEESGNLLANFTQSIVDITLYGAIVKRQDGEYFVNKDVEISVKAGGVDTQFEDLYTGDMNNRIVGHVLKMHYEDIGSQVKPAIENIISIIVDDITTKFFKSLPYDKLLPENV